eukprot:TRINITY_DN10051_c0_g1_i1.p1 TRINITY_DN10051_c0_g1~~TRINITY_DN10051_c0_g1_i1.p1  ORF type:complete len:196 (-),score=34.68 TRINITY_DN10051_c0_g1_i1:102-689(-)
MTTADEEGWKAINVPESCRFNMALSIQLQTSRSWHFSSCWSGVVGDKVVQLQQLDDQNKIKYRLPIQKDVEDKEVENLVKRFLRLDTCESVSYETWGNEGHPINKYFLECSEKYKGIRMLRHDLVECLYSTICSTNNNSARTTKMVQTLCDQYGRLIGTIDGNNYYEFPTLDRLSSVSESELRSLGFGYKAKSNH